MCLVVGEAKLPVIVGFGGYNAAGRSSGHLAYRRMIFESLGDAEQRATVDALYTLMVPDGGETEVERRKRVLEGTLVRRIGPELFEPGRVATGMPVQISHATGAVASRDLLPELPAGVRASASGGNRFEIELTDTQAWAEGHAALAVSAAGQLPSGFDPARYYRSLHHPRGLQLAVLAASDALAASGLAWRECLAQLPLTQIGVFGASVMSQLDGAGLGGMMQSRQRGQRTTSKQLALGLNTMPADFLNAYVLGNLGQTAGIAGACATFLYNLAAAVDAIKAGRLRFALVCSSEAPIVPEVIDGYAAMSALATDRELAALDGGLADLRRASRPFGENCGFTLAEAGQCVVLMDAELAVAWGARMHAAVPGVFIHADGIKKSISAPGPGNYLTFARAVGLARTLFGERNLQRHSFVHAHGSSTPQNRVTESQIFDRVARAFSIEHWPVAAVKAYVGHSLGPASGDQLVAALGTFAHGILPGIKTIKQVASDVVADRLTIALRDTPLEQPRLALLNSKGFGGNNASAVLAAPDLFESMVLNRSGAATDYYRRREAVDAAREAYLADADKGNIAATYRYGEAPLDDTAITISAQRLRVGDNELALDDPGGFTPWL